MLRLPVAVASRFVLVRPHYPENVGAAARAIKTMGITELWLVKPGRLAVPEHENAVKMAVRAWDVLQAARVTETLASALEGCALSFATTGKRGISGVVAPRAAAAEAVQRAARGERLAWVFGNEKTGLESADLERCSRRVRIPMAADQPSINLAQATQLVAYELFLAGLEARECGVLGAAPAVMV